MSAEPPLSQDALTIAAALTGSDLSGVKLSKYLHDLFPRARRSDVFLGVAIFVSDLQVDLLLAEARIKELEAALPSREAA